MMTMTTMMLQGGPKWYTILIHFNVIKY